MRKKVLIIDDEPTIRYALKRYFTRKDWEADEADNGHAGLDMLVAACNSGPEYDLVVSDIRMPGLTGGELYHALEEKCPEMLARLVFSTGDTTSKESTILQNSRCPVIQKPFELATLDKFIQQITGKSSDYNSEDTVTIQP